METLLQNQRMVLKHFQKIAQGGQDFRKIFDLRALTTAMMIRMVPAVLHSFNAF